MIRLKHLLDTKILFESLLYEDKIDFIKNKYKLDDNDIEYIKSLGIHNNYLDWVGK